MTQEPDRTREQPEFVVERTDGARGTGFRVTNDLEDQFFEYEKGDASSRESARAQAQQRAAELQRGAQQFQAEPDEEPEDLPPAPVWEAGPREEPLMARQQRGPERPRRRRRRKQEGQGRNTNLILVVLLLGVFGILMSGLLYNGLTQIAESRNGDENEEQVLTGTVDVNVNVTGLPENYPEEGMEQPDQDNGEDVDLNDPSRYVLPGGVSNAAEAQRHAENLGYTGVSSCSFISKADVSLKLASGEMPGMAHIQYRDANDEISYAYGKLEPEDYYFCSTFSGEVIWMMAKCGNVVRPPSKPPVPPEKKVAKFPVSGFWASCPPGTALPNGTAKRWFPGTTLVVYEWEAEVYARPGDTSIGWSRAFYEKVRPFLEARNDRVERFLAKCKKHPTPTPEPPDESPPPHHHYPPQPNVYYGVGTATWSVSTGNLCEPHGDQAASSGTVRVDRNNLHGRTLAAVRSYVSQADANAKAKAIAEAEANEIEEQKREYWEDHEDDTCDPQSQPSWADDRIRADDDEDDEDDHDGSYDEDDFTVEDSDEPDRDPPSEDDVEDDYDDPVQGENPEPRDDEDDDGGFDEPPPPPPSHSDKPTDPNDALW